MSAAKNKYLIRTKWLHRAEPLAAVMSVNSWGCEGRKLAGRSRQRNNQPHYGVMIKN